MDRSGLPTLAEGKTKVVHANPDDDATVYLYFKDDITAGDGAKRDSFAGKGALDWAISRDCFEYLESRGISTHYLASPAERLILVRRMERKLELEVVSRRVAAGSILGWGGVEEGDRFDPVVTRFHYKDDALHDPMLDERYVDYLVAEKDAWEYAAMREMNAAVLALLEEAFAQSGVQLVDLKLEYGVTGGALCLIDEISGGSLRLWPYRQDAPLLEGANLLAELDPDGRLDKDTYRMGEPASTVLSRFEAIAGITAGFKALA